MERLVMNSREEWVRLIIIPQNLRFGLRIRRDCRHILDIYSMIFSDDTHRQATVGTEAISRIVYTSFRSGAL